MNRRELLRYVGVSTASLESLPEFVKELLPEFLFQTDKERKRGEIQDAIVQPLNEYRYSATETQDVKEAADEFCKKCEEVQEQYLTSDSTVEDLVDIFQDDQIADDIENADSFQDLPVEARAALSSLEGFAELINEHFEIEIDTSVLEDVDDVFKKAESLVPLVYSVQRVADTGCTFAATSEGTDKESESFEEFLITVLVLVVEILAMKTSFTYRVSFWGTKKMNHLLLARTRKVIGLKGYALLLREVHWTIRDSISSVPGGIVETTVDISDESGELYETRFRDGDKEILEQLEELGDSDLRNLSDSSIFADD